MLVDAGDGFTLDEDDVLPGESASPLLSQSLSSMRPIIVLEGNGLTEGWREPDMIDVDLSVVCTFDETGFPKVVGLSMKASPIRPGDDGAGLELAAQVRNGSCCRSLADGLKEGSRWKQRFSMSNS